MIMMGRKEFLAVAHEAAKAANLLLHEHGRNARERGWVDALDFWLESKPTAAIAAMEAILQGAPTQDTLSAKVSHGIHFMLSDGAEMHRSIERVLKAHDADHASRGYALGFHAFTLDKTGE